MKTKEINYVYVKCKSLLVMMSILYNIEWRSQRGNSAWKIYKYTILVNNT